MLKIFHYLAPFIEDCYREYSVREYSRLLNVSPPTASKKLKTFAKEGLLKSQEKLGHLMFFGNKDSRIFRELASVYWVYKLEDLIVFLNNQLASPTIILYGSVVKCENTEKSDVDIAVIAEKQSFDIEMFEKKIKRKIHILWFSSFKDIKNEDLRHNILNGKVLQGRIKV